MKKGTRKNQTGIVLDAVSTSFVRTETQLRKHPLHILQSQGGSNVKEITIVDTDDSGNSVTKWRVLFLAPEGVAGPLAYRLDRLVIDRAIDAYEAKELPLTLALGTLNKICRDLDLTPCGPNMRNIRKAFLQLQGTMIDVETITAHQRWYRYEKVYFTGEVLENGNRADEVFITLSNTYRDFLRETKTRPLNYDYLRTLPPASARLYEIISNRIYAALRQASMKESEDRTSRGSPEARILYSEFCQLSALTRHREGHLMRKQMKQLLAPHIEKGYIAEVKYDSRRDPFNCPDWMMIYKPGEKAKQDFAVTERKKRDILSLAEEEDRISAFTEHSEKLSHRLQEAGITKVQAESLAEEKSEMARQWVEVAESGFLSTMRIRNPGGYLTKAILEGQAIPKRYERWKEHRSSIARPRSPKVENGQYEQVILPWWLGLPPQERHGLAESALAALEDGARRFYADMNRDGQGFIEMVYRSASKASL